MEEDYDILYSNYLNPHPMLIPSIVQSVLSGFSYSDLKRFRLVCNAWEYEASSILKSKTQIRFPSEKDVHQYITDLDENYCCDSYEFGPDVPLSSESVQTFFDLFGAEIRSVKFHQVEWTGPELWGLLSQKLPNLDELSVRIFIPRESNLLPQSGCVLPTIRILKLNFSIDKPFKQNPPPPLEVECPTILRDLLIALPNLEEVYCPSWPTYVRDRPEKVVSGLFYNVIFQYPEIQLPKLSYIHINASLDNAQIFQLMDKNFPLKELRLELYPDVKSYSFYFLLKSLETSLKSLVLIFHPDYDSENFDGFPILQNLEYLSLHKYCGPVDVIVRYLPNLKRLLMNDSYVTDELGMNHQRIQLQQVEELIIEGITYCPTANLRLLAINFPRLKKIRVQRVDDEMLRIIFERLEHLEELNADGKFTDAGISGIPLDICQNIFDVPDIDRVRYFPYIGRLKNLQRLCLNSWEVSYLSVLLGVNDCKKLKFKRHVAPQIIASG